jgi:hypothetical protein
MDNIPRNILEKMVADYGSDFLIDSPDICKNLLYDFCGSYYSEILVIIELLKTGIVKNLKQNQNVLPYEVTRQLLIEKLEQKTPFRKDTLKWGIDTWSIALGFSIKNHDCDKENSPNQQFHKSKNKLNIELAESPGIFNDFIFNFRQFIIPILMTAIQKYMFSFNLHYKSFTKI